MSEPGESASQPPPGRATRRCVTALPAHSKTTGSGGARLALRLISGLALASVLACATIGRNFDATGLAWLKQGETTKADVLQHMGTPWRVGTDAGDLTWTYGYYEYRACGDSNSKDLVIHFFPDGKVKSYTLNTSFPQEREKLDSTLKGK